MWSWRNGFWRLHYIHVLWLAAHTMGYYQSSSNMLEAVHGMNTKRFVWLTGRVISLDRVLGVIHVQDLTQSWHRFELLHKTDISQLPVWIREHHDAKLIERMVMAFRGIVNLDPVRAESIDPVTRECVWHLRHFTEYHEQNVINWRNCIDGTNKQRTEDQNLLIDILVDYIEKESVPSNIPFDRHVETQPGLLEAWECKLNYRLSKENIMQMVRNYWVDEDVISAEQFDEADAEATLDGQVKQTVQQLNIFLSFWFASTHYALLYRPPTITPTYQCLRDCNDTYPIIDDSAHFYSPESDFASPEAARLHMTGIATGYQPPKKRKKIAKEEYNKRYESLIALFAMNEYIGEFALQRDNGASHISISENLTSLRTPEKLAVMYSDSTVEQKLQAVLVLFLETVLYIDTLVFYSVFYIDTLYWSA